MNRSKGSGDVTISLSRRNLETLLKMLDLKVGMPHLRRQVGGGILTIHAQENEEHYASQERNEEARGRMGVGPEDLPDIRSNL